MSHAPEGFLSAGSGEAPAAREETPSGSGRHAENSQEALGALEEEEKVCKFSSCSHVNAGRALPSIANCLASASGVNSCLPGSRPMSNEGCVAAAFDCFALLSTQADLH